MIENYTNLNFISLFLYICIILIIFHFAAKPQVIIVLSSHCQNAPVNLSKEKLALMYFSKFYHFRVTGLGSVAKNF